MDSPSSSLPRRPETKSYGDLMTTPRPNSSSTLQDIPFIDSRRNSNNLRPIASTKTALLKRHKSLSSIQNTKQSQVQQQERKKQQQQQHLRRASMPVRLDVRKMGNPVDKLILIDSKDLCQKKEEQTGNDATPAQSDDSKNNNEQHALPHSSYNELSDLDEEDSDPPAVPKHITEDDLAQSMQITHISLSNSAKKVTFDKAAPQVLEYEQPTPIMTNEMSSFQTDIFEDASDDDEDNIPVVSADLSSSNPRPLPLIPFSVTMPSLRTEMPASPTHTELSTELMLQRQKISAADRLTLVMDNGEEKDKLERAQLVSNRSTPLSQQESSTTSSCSDARSDEISELDKSTLFLEESVIGALDYLSQKRRLRAESSDSSTGSSVASSTEGIHERAILEIPRDLTRKESLLDSERSLNTSHHYKNPTSLLNTVQESPSSLKLRDKIADRRRSLAKAFETSDCNISLAESVIQESNLFQDIPEGIVSPNPKVKPLVVEKVAPPPTQRVKVEPHEQQLLPKPQLAVEEESAKIEVVKSQNGELTTTPPLEKTTPNEPKADDPQTSLPSTPPISDSVSSFLPDLQDLDNGTLGMTEYLSPKLEANPAESHIAYSSDARPPSVSPFKGMIFDDEEKDASFADLRNKGQATISQEGNVDPTKRKIIISKDDEGLTTPIQSPIKLGHENTPIAFSSPASSSQITPEIPSPERTLSAPNGLKTRLSLSRRKPSELAETRKRISGANAGAGKLIKTHEVDIQKLAIPIQAEEFSPLSEAAYRTKSSNGQEMSKIRKLLSESRLLDVDIVESDDELFSESISRELDRVIERRNTRYTVKEKKEVVLATEIQDGNRFTTTRTLPQDATTRSLLDPKTTQKILAVAVAKNKALPSRPPPIPARSAQRQSRGNLQSILDDDQRQSYTSLASSPAQHREPFNASSKRETVALQSGEHFGSPTSENRKPRKGLAGSQLEVSRSPVNSALKQQASPRNAVQQAPSDSGRLFIRLVRLYDVNLPLAQGSKAKFNLTLDNGLHCVTTSYINMESSSSIDQEFELVASDDLEFIVTMKVKVDLPPPSRSPASSPTRQDKRKSINSLRSLFGSPKRNKAKKEMENSSSTDQGANSSLSSLAPLEHTIARDGSFARSYISFSQYADMIYGEPQTFEIACYNEWATDTTKLSTSPGKSGKPRRKPYWIGKLQVEMMYIPRACESESPPKSLKACLQNLEWASWHRQIFHEGFLSQLGGDCPYWRRRYFKLIGATLVAHSSNESRKPRTSINLARAEKVEPISGNDETSIKELRIIFGNGETLDFMARNQNQRDEWINQLNKVIGHVPPRRRWAELVLNERAKK